MNNIPEWLIDSGIITSSQDNATVIQASETKSINLTDDELYEEYDKIDACVENNTPYECNMEKFDAISQSSLREYASINNVKMVKSSSNDNKMIKQASVVVKEQEISDVDVLAEALGDPFHFDERTDLSHMRKKDWEKVSLQQNLNNPLMSEQSIISIGGCENSNINSDTTLAPNQNSITDPGAIERLAKSTVDDNGERLRKAIAEKKQLKKADHKEWEADKIKQMANNDIVPKGKVFPTEMPSANPGMNNNRHEVGLYDSNTIASMPERSDGELLAEANKARKESIQRKSEVNDWEKPSREQHITISDEFADSLKQLLNQ